MRYKVVIVMLLIAAIAPALFAQVAHASVTGALSMLQQLVAGGGHA
jgi:hypothetical protein